MRADYPVLIDACVLANQGVCDLLLRLAESPRLFVPHCSAAITVEVRRTHVEKLGLEERLAASFQAEVRTAFPKAEVTDFEPLMPLLVQTNEKDRHEVEAAMKAPCPLILTFNLKHFREMNLAPFQLRASSPDDYLVVLYEFDPMRVKSSLGEMAGRHKMKTEDVLLRLGKVIPKFACRVLDDVGK